MIRGNLLEAKSRHVSGEYQREVASLARATARDGHARETVRERSERFWRAIAHASRVAEAPRAGGHSMALSRALQAHHDLAHATGEQRKVTGEVQQQIARVIKAKCRLSALEKVRAKERTIRAHKLVERQGEEVLEVVLSRRVSMTRSRVEWSIRDSLRQQKNEADMPIQASAPTVDPHACAAPRSPEISPHDASEVRSVRPEPPVVSLHTVHSEEGRAGAALRMQIERAGSPLSCRLEATAPGRIGIVMEAASPSLVRALEGDRYGIMRRLSESGITVGGFEVRRDMTMRGALSGFLRKARQPREDDDENVIA